MDPSGGRELDPFTGTVIRASKTTAVRYERARPGELVHMDVKKTVPAVTPAPIVRREHLDRPTTSVRGSGARERHSGRS